MSAKNTSNESDVSNNTKVDSETEALVGKTIPAQAVSEDVNDSGVEETDTTVSRLDRAKALLKSKKGLIALGAVAAIATSVIVKFVAAQKSTDGETDEVDETPEA